MTREETISKALKLLQPYVERYEPKLKKAWWIEQDNNDMSIDFCPDCIDEALYNLRGDYLLKQRKLPIHLRDNPFSVFKKHTSASNMETEYFNNCNSCGVLLDYVILPCSDEIEKVIDYITTEGIDDYIGYQAYSLLYNDWLESDDFTQEESRECNLKLAELVLKIL
jgi:hypothetical protein